MATVQGLCDPRFENLKNILQENIKSGEELGASIAVKLDGKLVVDIHGGYLDGTKSKPWVEDTIVNVWSSTKNVAALAVLMLYDRGLLDVDEKVAKYWPEFAAKGKEDVKIRHLLSHTSGVSGWEEPLTFDDLFDPSLPAERLAAQAPWWEPGTASGYHSLTFGFLLGELVKRVSGKPLKQFVAEEIAGPLNADFQIGCKESDWHRVSDLIPPPNILDSSALDPKSLTAKTFLNPPPNAHISETAGWKNADIGAANGHTNARGICTILSAISEGGTMNGHKLLSQKTIDRIFEVQSDGTDLVIGAPVRFGIGYGLAGGGTSSVIKVFPPGDPKICFWGGWGGSWESMDLDRKLTVSYVMNKMGDGVFGNDRTWVYFSEVYKALESA